MRVLSTNYFAKPSKTPLIYQRRPQPTDSALSEICFIALEALTKELHPSDSLLIFSIDIHEGAWGLWMEQMMNLVTQLRITLFPTFCFNVQSSNDTGDLLTAEDTIDEDDSDSMFQGYSQRQRSGQSDPYHL